MIRYSVWDALILHVLAMHLRYRRGAFLFEELRFPFRGCLIAERNKSITPFLRLGVIDSCMHILYL